MGFPRSRRWSVALCALQRRLPTLGARRDISSKHRPGLLGEHEAHLRRHGHITTWKHLQRDADEFSRRQPLQKLDTIDVMGAIVDGMLGEATEVRSTRRVDNSARPINDREDGAASPRCLFEDDPGKGMRSWPCGCSGCTCSHPTTVFRNALHHGDEHPRLRVNTFVVKQRAPTSGALDIIRLI